jgi:hypothetical protein
VADPGPLHGDLAGLVDVDEDSGGWQTFVPLADLEAAREALRVLADSVERDRREPDKVLCHVQTARRALR